MQPDFIPPCPAHHAGFHCFETKFKPFKRGNFIFNPAIGLLIFDEVHRASGDSLNGDMVIGAASSGIPTLALTATLAHTPLQLRATGFLAGLHKLADFDMFCGRRGCRRVPMRGMQWLAPIDQQEQIMAAIGAQIIPSKGIRITREQIPDFPGRNIITELYDLPKEDTEELNALYELLECPLADLEARALDDKDPEHPLTKRLRARQRIELLKVGVAEELGREYLEEGKSVVWFVNYRQTIDELLRRFPGAGVIDDADAAFAADPTTGLAERCSRRHVALHAEDRDVVQVAGRLEADGPLAVDPATRRAGTSTRFSYGDDPGYMNLTDYGWYSGNSGGMTHPVGQKLPNPWGLYDMHGNVAEWCQDWYAPYPGGIAIDPQGPATGSLRIARGGPWFRTAGECRSAWRNAASPDTQGAAGFRVVLAPGPR
jgi:hypothetical protein